MGCLTKGQGGDGDSGASCEVTAIHPLVSPEDIPSEILAEVPEIGYLRIYHAGRDLCFLLMDGRRDPTGLESSVRLLKA